MSMLIAIEVHSMLQVIIRCILIKVVPMISDNLDLMPQFGSYDIKMSWQIKSYHVMSCHVMSCHVMSCHVMSCHLISISYHIIIMSCRILNYMDRNGNVQK